MTMHTSRKVTPLSQCKTGLHPFLMKAGMTTVSDINCSIFILLSDVVYQPKKLDVLYEKEMVVKRKEERLE